MHKGLRLHQWSYKDFALITENIKKSLGNLEDFRVSGLIVPHRPTCPHGHRKNEWGLRLTSRNARSSELCLVWSIQPQAPYLALYPPNLSPKAAPGATHSPFSLFCQRTLMGLRLSQIEALHHERSVILWFERTDKKIGLWLNLIPARPEALLIEPCQPSAATNEVQVLARSTSKGSDPRSFELPKLFLPQGEHVRPEVADTIRSQDQSGLPAFDFAQALETTLREEAHQARLKNVLQILAKLQKNTNDALKKLQTALAQIEKEPDHQAEGDKIKANLYQTSPQFDEEGATEIGRTAKEKMLKAYARAKRFIRKKNETFEQLQAVQERLQKLSDLKPSLGNLDAAESFLGLKTSPGASPTAAKGHPWPGRQARSKEGLTILIGKSKDENRELLTRYSRGNDLWLHVKGRPGAHAIIVLPPKKTASLETLLDAAHLVVYFSGGVDWGKTEVDYTYRKFVKTIKGSTEFTYSQNKTLVVEVNRDRIEKLNARSF